jgi:hypothetical protein
MGTRMLEGDSDGADEDGTGEVGQGGGDYGCQMGRNVQEGCGRRGSGRISGMKNLDRKRGHIQ